MIKNIKAMKRIILAIAIVAMAVYLASCTNSMSGQKRGSSGKTLEVLVVANKNVYYGNVKDSILALFHQPQFGLNQPEQSFDVVNIPISSLESTDMFKSHRNIIVVSVADSNQNKVSKANDRWAQPQVVFEFKLSSRDSVMPFLKRYYPIIDQSIKECEHARILRAYRGVENYSLMQKLRDTFGFEITISNEYYLCDIDSDFAWLRKETNDFSIGVIIRSLPYVKSADFEQKAILSNMDSTMKRIPGFVDSSYMATDRRMDAETKRVDFNDMYCVETRGIWHLEGKGYLSGPYVNYTLLSPDGETIVMITGYAQAPGKNKRDYLMQAESICYTLKYIDKKK